MLEGSPTSGTGVNLHLLTRTHPTSCRGGSGVNVAREKLNFLPHANECSFLIISTHPLSKLLGQPKAQQLAEC